MKLSHWLIFMCLMCITVSTSAQKRNKVYEDYIHKYRGIAVDEMKHYRIPASITLAQGLLESGAGKVSCAEIEQSLWYQVWRFMGRTFRTS